MNPKISIIIPYFNEEKNVEQCVNNLKEIDYSNLEIIFINDGSTDNSEELLLNKLKDIINIKFEENKGVFGAELEALSLASGEYILLHAFDDLIDSQLINRLLRDIQNYPLRTHFAVSNALMSNGQYTGEVWYHRFYKDVYTHLFDTMISLTGTVNLSNTLILRELALQAYTDIDSILKKAKIKRLDLGHDILVINHMILSGYIKKIIPVYHTFVGYNLDQHSMSRDATKRVNDAPIVRAYMFIMMVRKDIIRVPFKDEYDKSIILQATKKYGADLGQRFVDRFMEYKEIFEKVL